MMRSNILAVVSLALSVAAYNDIVKPIVDLNTQLFGMSGEDRFDQWHDANGKPNATHQQIVEVVSNIVGLWSKAGPQLATLAKTVDTSSATAGYVDLLDSLFLHSLYTPWFFRLTTPWCVALNFTEDQAKEQASRYDQAWLSAVLDVETVIPSVTRDYQVATPGFSDPGSLRADWFPAMADHLDAIPWEPVIQYCAPGVCSNVLRTYAINECHSTTDLGPDVELAAVYNAGRGSWHCQAYSDNACKTPVFIPALPCEWPPEWCTPTYDYDGKFGLDAGRSTYDNPSGVGYFPIGSFVCTP